MAQSEAIEKGAWQGISPCASGGDCVATHGTVRECGMYVVACAGAEAPRASITLISSDGFLAFIYEPMASSTEPCNDLGEIHTKVRSIFVLHRNT